MSRFPINMAFRLPLIVYNVIREGKACWFSSFVGSLAVPFDDNVGHSICQHSLSLVSCL